VRIYSFSHPFVELDNKYSLRCCHEQCLGYAIDLDMKAALLIKILLHARVLETVE